MAAWTIQFTDGGWTVQADGVTVVTGDDQGVRFAFLGAQQTDFASLIAVLMRGNALTLEAGSPPDPPAPGAVTLFVDAATGHLALMDDAGQVWPFDPRLFAAAPVAVAPKAAPPERAG